MTHWSPIWVQAAQNVVAREVNRIDGLLKARLGARESVSGPILRDLKKTNLCLLALSEFSHIT
jgi:hypothetical protein